MFIYKITNNVTGKAYIGATSNLTKRLSAHKHSEQADALHEEIRRYGWENFRVDVLFDGFCTEAELDSKERLAIREHKTLAPNGYNKQRGGGRKRPLVTEDAKRKAASLLHVPYSGRGG
jgi:group I intron endonuclease